MGEALRTLERKTRRKLQRHCSVRSFCRTRPLPNGNTEDLQRAFDLMECWLVHGNKNLRDLIGIGFLEDLQNAASWQAFGEKAFIPFLGPQCRQAWNEIERTWAVKQVCSKSCGPKTGSRSSWRRIPWLLKNSIFLPNRQNLRDTKCLKN
jgi:hypothetical protein